MVTVRSEVDFYTTALAVYSVYCTIILQFFHSADFEPAEFTINAVARVDSEVPMSVWSHFIDLNFNYN